MIPIMLALYSKDTRIQCERPLDAKPTGHTLREGAYEFMDTTRGDPRDSYDAMESEVDVTETKAKETVVRFDTTYGPSTLSFA
ncbi:MAG: hypothetical protein AAF488_00525 [Planctomycetota bacterium]